MKIMRNTFEECFIEYAFSILFYSGNRVSSFNLIQIQFYVNNWRPSGGWIWNTLPSFFAHTWWTWAQCPVSLTELQWDRLAWGSLVPPPSWHVCYWLYCWNDFTGWQCISEGPENEHNLNCENEHCFGVGKLMRFLLTLTVCIKRKCYIKLFDAVYWQMSQKYIDL